MDKGHQKRNVKNCLLATYGKTIGLVLVLALAMAAASADGLWVKYREPPTLERHGPYIITTTSSHNPHEYGFLSVSWIANGLGHLVAPWGERSGSCTAMAALVLLRAFGLCWLWCAMWHLGSWLQSEEPLGFLESPKGR